MGGGFCVFPFIHLKSAYYSICLVLVRNSTTNHSVCFSSQQRGLFTVSWYRIPADRRRGGHSVWNPCWMALDWIRCLSFHYRTEEDVGCRITHCTNIQFLTSEPLNVHVLFCSCGRVFFYSVFMVNVHAHVHVYVPVHVHLSMSTCLGPCPCPFVHVHLSMSIFMFKQHEHEHGRDHEHINIF